MSNQTSLSPSSGNNSSFSCLCKAEPSPVQLKVSFEHPKASLLCHPDSLAYCSSCGAQQLSFYQGCQHKGKSQKHSRFLKGIYLAQNY